jgi:serine/threonine-protein kinase
MLTGFAPFWGGDLDTVFYQVINEMPAAPSSRNQRIPTAFDYIVAKAMAKHPDDRYTDARAIAADLRNYRALRPAPPAVIEARTLERRAIRRRKGDVPPAEAAASASSETAQAQRRRLILYGMPAALGVLSASAWIAGRLVRSEGKAQAQATASEGKLVRDESPVAPATAIDVGAKESTVQRPASSTVSAAKAAPSQPASTNVKSTTATKPSARVSIAVAPWGDVYVDGTKKGRSPPLTELRLAPGKHRIEIVNPGYPSHVETVMIEPGATLRIKHRFR